jgi:hypothetical protein
VGKFRKRPVVIEAFRFLEGQPMDVAPQWYQYAWTDGLIVMPGRVRRASYGEDGDIVIGTLEGPMVGRYGDWIIRGVRGELYACKPEIFAATYEAVDDGPGEDGDVSEADHYADWRFVAVRQMDDGSYGMSSTLALDAAIARAARDVEQSGAGESTVCEVITTFQRRYLSVEVKPRGGHDWTGESMLGVGQRPDAPATIVRKPVSD